MFRNLALPVVIVFTMSLTACQSVLFRERPEQDDSVVQPVPAPVEPERPVVSPQLPEVSQRPAVPKTHTMTIHEQTIQTPAHVDGRLVLGINETVTLPNLDLKMEAKLDTGAENSSADARNIQFFERDGRKWVKFDLPRTSEGTVPMEMPLKGTIFPIGNYSFKNNPRGNSAWQERSSASKRRSPWSDGKALKESRLLSQDAPMAL